MATVKKLPTTSKKKSSKQVEAIAVKLPEAQAQTNVAPSWYPIDWETVKTIDDIKAILEHMGLGCSTDAPAYDKLKKYLFQNYVKIK